MKVLGIIPARGGSKGIPRKNVRLLAGKPLIAYTIEKALESKYLSRIIVSTDDEEIANTGIIWGADVPFMRPSELASDQSATLPVVLHALDMLEAAGESYDAVCLLQATSPFRQDGLIDSAIEKIQQTNADALISVLSVPHEYNPHWVFEPQADGFLSIATGEEKIISRRQDLPEAYIRDGAIYITKTEVLRNQNSLFGSSLTFIQNKSPFHVNLDTLEDWKRAEKIISDFGMKF